MTALDSLRECENCIHPADHHSTNGGCTGFYVDPVTREETFCSCSWDGVQDCGHGWTCPNCRAGILPQPWGAENVCPGCGEQQATSLLCRACTERETERDISCVTDYLSHDA